MTLRTTPRQRCLLSFPESSPPPSDPPLEISITGVGHPDRLESTQNVAHGVPQPVGAATSHHQPNEGNQIPTPSRWNETVLSEQSSSERQTAMLRFRYQIAPWLDSNAPKSLFGPQIMTLAAEKTVIMDVIVWVAMRRSRGNGHSTDQDGDSHFVQQIQHRLSLGDAFTTSVGRSLLALGDFFYTCPSDWSSFHGSNYLDLDDRYQFFADQEEPLKTLSRFHFKIGMTIIVDDAGF
ncbi:hypothetical protein FSARC_8777 [Fusarium sarcochroum]|uniref:Uncharacterized protein n=1 Tax=Fusarium sarcochroum TaxID=1208366 RepID=A0A8H4X6T3_9HYPO|nr:hypothetical protein FSARC_8777 [Fusarium sarcochroum]